jgi:hypothetical protein
MLYRVSVALLIIAEASCFSPYATPHLSRPAAAAQLPLPRPLSSPVAVMKAAETKRKSSPASRDNVV